MNASDILQQLEAMGSEQYRKTYRRHGVVGDIYGVSFGNLSTLVKQIKKDHEAALALWKTGNHDARILATMIADPNKVDIATLQQWMADADSYPITSNFATFVAKTPHRRALMTEWTAADDDEWVGYAGWLVLAAMASNDADLPDEFFTDYLDRMEARLHTRPNYVRDGMNSALIAIGTRNERLEAAAVAAAERIGKVEVDHGETGCVTQPAIPYIAKVKAYQAQKAEKAAAKKRATA